MQTCSHWTKFRYEIIDYKAAKQVATQEQVDSSLQLGIYGLAFKLTTGKLPLLSFYFLPENTKVTSVAAPPAESTAVAVNVLDVSLPTVISEMFNETLSSSPAAQTAMYEPAVRAMIEANTLAANQRLG